MSARPLSFLIIAALAMTAGAAGSEPTQPPRIDLLLAPRPGSGNSSGVVAVTMRLERPALPAGAGLVHLPLVAVGIPSARYDGDALSASDDAGPVPLRQQEETPTPTGTSRRWLVGRATVGDVVVRYAAPPRRVVASTNNGPLFDLREEAGGFAGAGVGFIATPVAPGPYRVHLHWDLSGTTAPSRGVWSLGDGDVEKVVGAEELAYSFYAAGPLRTLPARAGQGPLRLFWLAMPPFDPAVLGSRLDTIYAGMTRFFGDDGAPYRVFLRQNPYPGMGGTQLAHSFMFGYHPEDAPTVDRMQGLLSHEMVHGFVEMQGDHGDTAWYTEGTAEYYSMMVARRAGALDRARFVAELNKKAYAYYTNPYVSLTNGKAAKLFWTDPTAQTVPYGRGLLYLIRTDAAIRSATRGRRSLDDVVLALRRRQKAGQSYGVADWLSQVSRYLGSGAARADFGDMTSGRILRAPMRWGADSCLVVKHEEARVFELGFARASLAEGKVRNLVAGSAAATAGLHEGDMILSSDDPNKVSKAPDSSMTVTVDRAGRASAVRYLPRGRSVQADQWAVASGCPAIEPAAARPMAR